MKLENEVILLSVLAKRTEKEEERLSKIIKNEELDWGYIAGELIHHRLTGYFYFYLGDELMNFILLEFKKTITLLVNAQETVAKSCYKEMQPILQDFENTGIRYTALKGLVYGISLYPYGARRSNDCDLLVLEDDISKVDQVLRKHGYIQSSNFGKSEATKKEKLIQRMNYHDLIPYYKKVNLVLQDSLNIDVNFHFDSKDNDITKAILELGTEIKERDGIAVRTLNEQTHFLHLCVHFYREASNSLWTSIRRDVLLYKLVDIVNTFRTMTKGSLLKCIEIGKKYNIEKAVYFTLYYMKVFYKDNTCSELLNQFSFDETAFLNEIEVVGQDKKVIREESFYERTFNLKFCHDFRTKRG
ncbi:hypothetical protein CLTEP_21070 [Clostridium tepidiprofundi DSM 19306]|uniref:Nucleotidyltransferase domain protein n=1 Tax=Clostridium tepidiprofundi DSM 19306 TaxID=1121338 RepID=A0A151B2D4_9CLOT|nr:nucleotidyltransferase family protein [Clostridium tepidiprofundi]KYH33970.1 hypothetical protein CLTEP_21070 [Clostridium tepidiprofundi DSM 19306]